MKVFTCVEMRPVLAAVHGDENAYHHLVQRPSGWNIYTVYAVAGSIQNLAIVLNDHFNGLIICNCRPLIMLAGPRTCGSHVSMFTMLRTCSGAPNANIKCHVRARSTHAWPPTSSYPRPPMLGRCLVDPSAFLLGPTSQHFNTLFDCTGNIYTSSDQK
jgi:hypothetical protein